VTAQRCALRRGHGLVGGGGDLRGRLQRKRSSVNAASWWPRRGRTGCAAPPRCGSQTKCSARTPLVVGQGRTWLGGGRDGGRTALAKYARRRIPGRITHSPTTCPRCSEPRARSTTDCRYSTGSTTSAGITRIPMSPDGSTPTTSRARVGRRRRQAAGPRLGSGGGWGDLGRQLRQA
jgi:hypothetical protein